MKWKILWEYHDEKGGGHYVFLFMQRCTVHIAFDTHRSHCAVYIPILSYIAKIIVKNIGIHPKAGAIAFSQDADLHPRHELLDP